MTEKDRTELDEWLERQMDDVRDIYEGGPFSALGSFLAQLEMQTLMSYDKREHIKVEHIRAPFLRVRYAISGKRLVLDSLKKEKNGGINKFGRFIGREEIKRNVRQP